MKRRAFFASLLAIPAAFKAVLLVKPTRHVQGKWVHDVWFAPGGGGGAGSLPKSGAIVIGGSGGARSHLDMVEDEGWDIGKHGTMVAWQDNIMWFPKGIYTESQFREKFIEISQAMGAKVENW